jgi:hypothetical protein
LLRKPGLLVCLQLHGFFFPAIEIHESRMNRGPTRYL